MDLGTFLQAYWPAVVICLAIGFILGWLIVGLPPRRKLAESESSAQDLDWKLREANKGLTASQNKAQELQTNFEATRAALVEANNQTTAANSHITGLQDDLVAAQQQVQELQSGLVAARQQGQELQANLAAAQQQDQELQANLDEANNQLVSLRQVLSTRDADLAELKMQQTALRATAQQSYDALTAQVEELRTQGAALAEENGILKQNLEGTSADLAKARADVEALTQVVSNKDTALTEAYARAVRLEREASEGQSQLLGLQAELSSTKRNIATLSATNQDMNNRLENARGEVANELAVLTSTMLRVKDEQLAQANATIAALQAQLAQSTIRHNS